MSEQVWGGAREEEQIRSDRMEKWGSETMGKWWEAPNRYKEGNKYVRREGG